MSKILQKIIEYATRSSTEQVGKLWKFHTNEDGITILPNYTYTYRYMESDCYYKLFISLGALLENFVIAANFFGYKEQVNYHFNDSDSYIKIQLTETSISSQKDLFEVMDNQQVIGKRYSGQRIPADQLAQLITASKEADVYLKIFSGAEAIGTILPILEEGIRLLPTYKKVRPYSFYSNEKLNHPALHASDDFRSEFIDPIPNPSWLDKFLYSFMISEEEAVIKTMELLESSSALLLFAALHDDRKTWINVGRTYERIALTAATYGIEHENVSSPCEVASVRKILKQELGHTHEEPLLIMRLGYPENITNSYKVAAAEAIYSN